MSEVVKEYDDENITDDCDDGWRRFCSEVLIRASYHLRDLCRRLRLQGWRRMLPNRRKAGEILRQQVAAYRWVFEGQGGDFSFDRTCEDVGLDPYLVRQKLLRQCDPPEDINLLVREVLRQEVLYAGRAKRRRKDQVAGGVGTSIVPAVRDLRSRNATRSSRRGAQTHAVCRYQNDHPSGRRLG